MSAIAYSAWLLPLLRRLPARWLAGLDAWSYRIALRQRERRRTNELRRQP
ncbi:hypothetical protein [Ramlibacter sp. WS9]|nr:hypothetical protein [Ramlibacter sp. WS9]